MMRRRGFTIIELLVYVSISAAALVIFSVFVANVIKDAGRSQAAKEVEQSVQLMMERITQDIQHARAVSALTATSITLTTASGSSVSYAYDSVAGTVTYPSSASQISSPQVRVTALNFSGVDPAITVSLAAEQREVSHGAAAYRTSLSTTAVRRRALYQ